uniref:Putative secreted peptide n=1 Tax=Anopheles braziliensis TaxID=58242 RepID=A0A2M3ZT78_9DIPT
MLYPMLLAPLVTVVFPIPPLPGSTFPGLVGLVVGLLIAATGLALFPSATFTNRTDSLRMFTKLFSVFVGSVA